MVGSCLKPGLFSVWRWVIARFGEKFSMVEMFLSRFFIKYVNV